MKLADNNHSHLMLRRNLATWKLATTIEETLAFCKATGVGEVIWKTDPEAFNHGHTPIEMISEQILPGLIQAKQKLNENGIIFSINPWLTFGHASRGRYLDGPPPGFHWRVLPNGTELSEMACPLASGWREWLIDAYRLYASTKPDKLWLEDEFKTFGHAPWDLGCYCEKHLAEFSKRLGESFTRVELIERITAPGEPDPLRTKWFDFQGEIMLDVCRELEKAVHDISPDTRLGLMCSWSTDGRWWEEAVNILAGRHRPLSRTSLAPYNEGRAIDFIPDTFDILKETACLSTGTENCPELENSYYTPYSKSVRMTRLQMALSQLLGNRSITMNIFDMVGSDTSEDPRLGKLLKEIKPKLDAIASSMVCDGKQRGINIPFNKRYADFVQVEEKQSFENFRFDGDSWSVPLQASGVPIVFNGESNITALTGQSVRAMSDEQIEKILKGGLLLDGSAASVLCRMGYGKQIGIKVNPAIERYDVLVSAERDDWAEPRARDDNIYMSLERIAKPNSGRIYPLKPLDHTQVISSFVDYDHKVVMPGFVAFENPSGGRVATYPFDLSHGIYPGFMNWHRRRQMQRIIRWLGCDRVELFADGGAWMVPIRRDYADYTLIAVLNFETDDWDDVTLTFEHGRNTSPTFEILNHDGQFEVLKPDSLKVAGENIVVKLGVAVATLDFIVFRIKA